MSKDKEITNLFLTFKYLLVKCDSMKAENEAIAAQDVKKELQELKLQFKKLKVEHASFHDIADKMIEEKDNEISRLSDYNRNLRQSLQSRPHVDHSGNDNYNTVDSMNLSPSAAEQQLLEEIEELERENRLHSQQEAILKAELRDMERSKKREGIDMTYLKNVILELLETVFMETT
ncbi:hypothetical protein Ahy_A04g019273 [Arachis hypogaea]|uniref:Uncharacterized protein n=1 Tax=Arachis hypogaea TaxID=3818 RepID=A0A445DFU3_ARAHY|nr:hypothetical protein Ahy_A04g019273 [Arachis hypogaea]